MPASIIKKVIPKRNKSNIEMENLSSSSQSEEQLFLVKSSSSCTI